MAREAGKANAPALQIARINDAIRSSQWNSPEWKPVKLPVPLPGAGQIVREHFYRKTGKVLLYDHGRLFAYNHKAALLRERLASYQEANDAPVQSPS